MGIVRWTTDPADATYQKLISFEGERLRTMDEDGVAMHVADGALAAGAAGDHRHGARLAKRAAQRVGVISFIGEHVAGATYADE